jgi:cytochrome c-type biogenesis protein
MGLYVEAFTLGNAAILGNVCLLPLYPGLFALLADRTERDDEHSVRWLGVVVLAGVLAVMVGLAALLYAVNRAFADIVPWVVPVAYGLVIVLGLLMLADRNPLARLGTGEVPLVGSPTGSAFVYGMALGPMTLPCTGPVILSAFVLGGVSGTGALTEGIAYFLVFGLGFGWPLVVLPLLAGGAQRRVSRFLGRHHRTITVASGALLVAVATWGLWVEFA